MPDSSNRYAGNVPAGTATFSIAPTFTLTVFVTPSPDEKTLRLNVLPVSSGSAGRNTLSALSSIVAAVTVVSTLMDFGVPFGCGDIDVPFTRPSA